VSYFEYTQRDLDEARAEGQNERDDLVASVEGLTDENLRLGRTLDKDSEIVGRAVSDLRSIGDVPLKDIDGYIEAVIETLRAVRV
jgi:hypothetical protein